jgi:VWFA-related protein
MKMSRVAVLAGLLIAFRALAQVPYIESVEVRVHSVDVVVTDAKGKPVTGLTKDDFELYEDGKQKQISNFSSFTGMERQDRADAPVGSAGAGATVPAPNAPLAARKFIFYIDEMSLSQPAAKKLKAQLDHLFDTTLRDGDAAMIVRPAEEQKLKMPFSTDRAAVRTALLDAIDRENWRATAPILRELRQLEIELRGVAGDAARRAAARRWANLVRNRVQQRLGQLRAVVTASGELPGRKVLVLVTESMPLEPGKEAFTAMLDGVSEMAAEEGTAFGDWAMLSDFRSDWVNLTPLVEEIARSAATSGVTIYALQAEYGQDLLAPGGNIGGPTPGREAWGDPAAVQRTRRASTPIPGTMGNYKLVEHMSTNTEGTLRKLAETTGGTWHRGGLSFDNMVDDIALDVSSYYSLGYRAGQDLDVPHRLEVRVKGRPELRVRARQEVLRKSPQREMTDRVVASLLVPVPSNELDIRVASEVVPTPKEQSSKLVHVAVSVPLSKLTFVPDGDKLKASFSVHYAVLGARSEFVSGVHGIQVVEIPAADYEAKKNEVWTYVAPFHFSEPRSTVTVGVLDTLSNLSGFGTLEIELK